MARKIDSNDWNRYIEIRLESFEELVHFQKAMRYYGGAVYRGQSNASWELETQIRRNRSPQMIKGLAVYEHHILRMFKRQCHLHDPSICPADSDTLDWLALIQHYGGPTRLLDFTNSIYIAAFFAIGLNNTSDAAIWAVREGAIGLDFNEARYESEKDSLAQEPDENLRNRKANQICWFGHTDGERLIDLAMQDRLKFPGVFKAEPYRMNRRLAVQQGLFLVPTRLQDSFVANISGMIRRQIAPQEPVPFKNFEPGHYAVIKLHIPKTLFREFRAVLDEMNLTAVNLFPDLDGLARWLHYLVPNSLPSEEREREEA